MIIQFFQFYENEMPQNINDPLFKRIDCVLLDLATEYRGPLIVKKNLLIISSFKFQIIVS